MTKKSVSRNTRSRVSRPAPLSIPAELEASVAAAREHDALEAAYERLSAVSLELQGIAAGAPADVRTALHAALAALAGATSYVSSALALYEGGRS